MNQPLIGTPGPKRREGMRGATGAGTSLASAVIEPCTGQVNVMAISWSFAFQIQSSQMHSASMLNSIPHTGGV